ncbi:MAG: VWA domain-containing protein [Bacteroidota bacterium]|nr:VWA domain-containing protein [Candidatus Kapabacteria bacterium]MDW8219920.1 VWA domain-containing protein [Bacteroidota bacterium]
MNAVPFTFKNPEMFWLLLLIPLLAYRYYRIGAAQGEIRVSNIQGFATTTPTLRLRLRHTPFVLRLLAIVCLIIALARPQSSSQAQTVESEGIDIVLAMDISGSMLAEDFKPNRIEAAKKLALEFIDARPNDRIGLVVFSGESFTQCPLTTDHEVLKSLFSAIKSGMVLDGTAIGLGLSTAVSRLKDSQAKSKVIILLTDGINNAGSIAPLTAAEIARTFGIRVYTIGVGTYGYAPYPVQTPFGIQYQNLEVQIDEDVMKQIAAMTNARYFRATSNAKLQEIYAEIDKLEKTKISVTEFRRYSERFFPFACIAAIALLLEFVLRHTVFRSIP